MKKIILKLLSLLLIFAMLLPMAIACKKDPPPNKDDGDDDDDTENNSQSNPLTYVKVDLVGWDDLVLVDLSSEDMAAINRNFKENQVYNSEAGQSVYRWDTGANSSISLVLGKTVDISSYHFVEFTFYSPAATRETVTVNIGGIGSTSFKLDFSGWRTIRIRTDSFSVKNPYPPMLSIDFSCSSEQGLCYVYGIKATSPKYELTFPEGVSQSDSAIYDYVIDRYVQYEMGLPEQGENPTASRASRVYYIDDVCRRGIDKFNATYEGLVANTLFGLIIDMTGSPTYSETGDEIGLAVRSLYNQINGLARAYACYGGNYYKNAELLDKIKKGLEYGYKFCYGEPILQNGKTWGDWYNWDIAIPEHLLATLMLIHDELSQDEINKYLAPYYALVARPYGTASNLLAFCRQQVLAGALSRDPMRIAVANEAAKDAYTNLDEIPKNAPVTPTSDGFYSDGSFIQHSTIAYTGSYGMGLLGSTASLIYLTAGGVFEPQGESIRNHYEWIFDAFIPIVYGKSFMSAMNGRDTFIDSDSSKTKLIVQHALTIITYAPDDVKSRLLPFIKACMIAFDDDFSTSAPMHLIDYCIALKADSSVTPAAALEVTEIFGAMERAVQHTPKYGVCVAMSSARIGKYESINTQNEAAWYQGDGMIYIYTDGYDYNKFFYYFANPYHMPGTTVNTAKREYKCWSPSLLGTNDYSGGVEHGKYGAAGFVLSYNPNAAYSSGTFQSIDATKITAKKSYFFFDNEIVCVGSDIHDKSGTDVLTVIENRMWNDSDVFSINGEAVNPTAVAVGSHSPSAPQTTVNARTMHFTNMGGYVFIRTNADGSDKDGNILSYAKVTNPFIENGDSQYISNSEKEKMLATKRSFLEITFNHGKGNDSLDGKYAYVYLPNATVQETESYYQSQQVAILARDSNLHAVLETELGVLGCIFFEGTELEISHEKSPISSIQAETPCAVMISKNADGSYTISLSDPTQTYSNVKLSFSIDGISEVVSADAGVNASISGSTVTLNASTKGMIGQTLNLIIK